MVEHYFLYDKETKVINHTQLPVFNGTRMAEYPSTALTAQPLEPKKGHVVIACDFDKSGKPHSTKYLEDHIGKTIWLKSNCKQSKQVDALGVIEDGWTLIEPRTAYDKWIDDIWKTDVSAQYIDKYDQVDDTRRYLYSQMCDPLYTESGREKRKGNVDIAQALEIQADAAAEKIKADNPFPTAPTLQL